MKHFTDTNTINFNKSFISKRVNKYIFTGLHVSEILSNTIGALVLTVGVIKGLIMLRGYFHQIENEKEVILARLEIAESVLLGMTFMLAADVIKTIRIPSFLQLIRVTILIGVREFLTYHLDIEYKDLKVIKKTFKS